MEIIFLYVFLVLFYFHTEVIPPLLPFLVITVGGGLVFSFILSLMKSNTPYVVLMLFVPVLSFLGSKLGLSFGICLFLSAFICWRIVGHFRKDTKLSDFWLLFLSLGIGFLIYLGAVVQGYIYSDLILYLLITQLLWMMISKMLVGFINNTFSEEHGAIAKHSGSLFGMFAGLVVSALLLAVGLPFLVKNLLSLFFSLTGKALYAASVPLFNAVENADFKRNQQGEQEDGVGFAGALEDLTPIQDYFKFLSNINIWTVLSIIGLIILAVIIFFLAKRKYIAEPAVDQEGMYEMTVGNAKQTTSKNAQRKRTYPIEKVRKLILDLELLSAKKGKGRLHSETVEEWLARNQFLNNQLVEAYEKVRYGESILSESESQLCEEIVKQLKAELRRLKK